MALAAKPTLLFLGDSHVRTARSAHEQGLLGDIIAEFLPVGGATAVGLRHPRSRTQALQVFRERLLPHQPGLVPVFQLGEVDCGFVAWVRSQRYGESVTEQIEQAIAAYAAFLRDMRDAGYASLMVTSAILPTIRDGELEGEVQHLRREVKASQADRTRLTIRYNAMLAQAAAHLNLGFYDLTPALLHPRKGVIRPRYRAEDTADHHLRVEMAAKLWARVAKAALHNHALRQAGGA
jgi:hypothetical protein